MISILSAPKYLVLKYLWIQIGVLKLLEHSGFDSNQKTTSVYQCYPSFLTSIIGRLARTFWCLNPWYKTNNNSNKVPVPSSSKSIRHHVNRISSSSEKFTFLTLNILPFGSTSLETISTSWFVKLRREGSNGDHLCVINLLVYLQGAFSVSTSSYRTDFHSA